MTLPSEAEKRYEEALNEAWAAAQRCRTLLEANNGSSAAVWASSAQAWASIAAAIAAGSR